MKAEIQWAGKRYSTDFNKPIDISIPLRGGTPQLKCFYAPDFEINPVRTESFIGDLEEGGILNFKNIILNPHGNGTHTECVGHIIKGDHTINQHLTKFIFPAQLITIKPAEKENGDKVIEATQIQKGLEGKIGTPALIVRTNPNLAEKLTRDYSGINPPYFTPEAMKLIVEYNIEHLLTDLPSVDKELDDGRLSAHKIFWNVSNELRTNASITELIYVHNYISDGLYLLNIQISSIEMDASPSKPILYKIQRSK